MRVDKEFLRIWFRDHCDPYNDATLPAAPVELVAELSSRYVRLYEMITGSTFAPANTGAVELARLGGALFPAARSTIMVVRTGAEETDGAALAASRATLAAGCGSFAVELVTANAVESPLALFADALQAKGRVRVALVLDGPAAGATAAVIARHGGFPALVIGAGAAGAPAGVPVAAVETIQGALAIVTLL